MSVTSKVFSRVILNRISTVIDPMLRKNRPDSGKEDLAENTLLLFTLRQILGQCQEWKTPCYVNFIDFEMKMAFDSIHINSPSGVYITTLRNSLQ